MRGKEDTGTAWRWLMRITPAYAGKRIPGQKMLVQQWDHPRVCGEKEFQSKTNRQNMGSPPRMRGKATFRVGLQAHPGITPAYAGKSIFLHIHARAVRDHPRVCGEKHFGLTLGHDKGGSPPRMRGKGKIGVVIRTRPRITPAYAGKRTRQRKRQRAERDHPRVCGEKKKMNMRKDKRMGSPPRMRGKD